MRQKEGALDADLLFPTGSGAAASKAGSVASLQKVLVQEGEVRIDGHSLRRVGAQMLARAGIEPWLVEWFGRWGSSAIRAYIEDARAVAPVASQLAMRVCGGQTAAGEASSVVALLPSREVDSAGEKLISEEEPLGSASCLVAITSGEEANRDGERQAFEVKPLPLASVNADRDSLVQLIAEVVREQAQALGKEAVLVEYASGKVHACYQALHAGGWRGQVALCGWHFGAVREEAVTVVDDVPMEARWCRRCRARALRLSLTSGGSPLVREKGRGARPGEQSAWASEGTLAAGSSEAVLVRDSERGHASSSGEDLARLALHSERGSSSCPSVGSTDSESA